jgi:DedD protein
MANNISPTIEELQLRKRARRRLIGAITLVALMVAILPMVLDNDPKPIGPDVEINIPSSKSSETFKSAESPAPPVTPPEKLPEKPLEPKPVSSSVAVVAKVEPKPEPVMKSVAASKNVAEKTTEKQEKAPQSAPKPVEKPAPSKPPVEKPAAEPQKNGSHIVLLGAFLGESNAKQRQAKLKELGVKFYVETIKSPAGDKIAVRAGPYASREEAERALDKLKSAGIQDGMVAEKK